MATVISNEKLSRHTIDKYNFKVLAVGGSQEQKREQQKESVFATQVTTENKVQNEEPKETQSTTKDKIGRAHV